MDNSITVLTVSPDEWKETKALLHSIAENVNSLTRNRQKEFLTSTEVMKELKIGKSTFYRWVYDGTLKPAKVPGKRKTYYRRSDIEVLSETEPGT